MVTGLVVYVTVEVVECSHRAESSLGLTFHCTVYFDTKKALTEENKLIYFMKLNKMNSQMKLIVNV